MAWVPLPVLTFTPQAIPTFTGSLDYYQIHFKREIGTVPETVTLQQCLTTGDPTLCSQIIRAPSGALYGTTPADGDICRRARPAAGCNTAAPHRIGPRPVTTVRVCSVGPASTARSIRTGVIISASPGRARGTCKSRRSGASSGEPASTTTPRRSCSRIRRRDSSVAIPYARAGSACLGLVAMVASRGRWPPRFS